MQKVYEAEHLLGVQNRLGEGPTWNAEEGRLYWVDIEGHLVNRYDPARGQHESFDMGQQVGALAFRASGGLVVALRDRLAFWEVGGEPEYIPGGDPERGKAGARFNDGAVDPAGRFWIGTICNDPTSSLYRLDPDHTLHTMVRHVTNSNGIGWSPDRRTMYYTDTPTLTIWAFDYDEATGAIENRRPFVQSPDAEGGYPDGLTVDAEGCVWSAYWGGWRVVRYDPEGKAEREVKLPVAQVTACAFGGERLTELYITSAWNGLSEEERGRQRYAGDLFVVRTEVRGQVDGRYGG